MRVDCRLADQAGRREMHHGDDVVLRERGSKRSLVDQVADQERTGDEAAMAGRKIIEGDRMITCGSQRATAMRADVARTAGNQDGRLVGHVAPRLAARFVQWKLRGLVVKSGIRIVL